MRVGFIGLGQMGSGMAANLLRAGHQVVVYNRTADKAEPLLQAGATLAPQIADVCDCTVVFTMLADDAAVERVALGAGGLLTNLEMGAVHVCCATISMDLAARLAERHTEAGQHYVSAPVFGRPDAAATAKLFVIAAGPDGALQLAKPLLETIGQRTFMVGERPPLANLIKLSGNFLIASVLESVGEAMALVNKAGIDRHQYLDILTSTLFTAPVYKNYGALIADRKFEPAGFAALLGLKDIRLALAAADELRVPMPVAGLLRDRLLTLLATGGGKLDWSAIGALPARDAGTLT